MSVKIRLKRLGKIRVPEYRIVVVDSRKKRDGRVIEEIGKYHPKEEPSFIEVTSDRAEYWLGSAPRRTEPVAKLLKITGDWQKFKGEPGTEGTLRVKRSRSKSKLDIFNEAPQGLRQRAQGRGRTKRAAKKAAAPLLRRARPRTRPKAEPRRPG